MTLLEFSALHPSAGKKSYLGVLANLCCVGLLILAVIKLIFITTSTPMFGYANNFDFIRQSSCLGLWVYVDGKQSRSASPWAPSATYDGDIDPSLCQRSIDTAAVSELLNFHQVGDSVSLQEVGFIRALILLSLVMLFLCFHLSLLHKLFTSLLFFLIFFDISNLLYFNTLYLEASVLIGLFSVIAGLFLLITSPSPSSKKILYLFLISLLILGLSKEQYVYLAVLFILAASGVLISRKEYVSALIASAFIAIVPLAYYSMNNAVEVKTIADINLANKANTYLGAVLPEATNQSAALKIMGLPESCKQSIGLHWYAPEYQSNRPCPEIFKASRLRLVPLFITQPSTLINPIMNMIQKIYPLRIPNLAFYEPGNQLSINRLEVLQKYSLSSAIQELGPSRFVALTLFCMGVFFPLMAIVLVYRLKKKAINPMMYGSITSALMGSFIINYAIISSVFGDGYTEPQKHAFTAIVGFALVLIAFIFIIFLLAQWPIKNYSLFFEGIKSSSSGSVKK